MAILRDRVSMRDLEPDLTHGSEGHRLVALIIEELRGATLRIVTYYPLKDDHGAVFGRKNALADGRRVDRLPGNLEDMSGVVVRASAHRRKERDLIAVGDSRSSVSELVVAGDHNAGLEVPASGDAV